MFMWFRLCLISPYLRLTIGLLKDFDEVLKRGEMAKAILQKKFISPIINPTGTEYDDVQALHLYAGWIEKFKALGFTGGCNNNKFCPDMVVTKEQMAIIFLKAKYGSAFTPTPSSNYFTDVPSGNFNADWITELRDQNWTSGCDANKFCPKQAVTLEWFYFLLKKLP